MEQAITLLIVFVCAALLVRMAVRKLRRKDCGCGGGSECRSTTGCEGCGLKDNCSKKEKK